MTKESTSCGNGTCCQVEAVLSVDERGQMVLPKALRNRLGIEPGDKLAAVTMERGEEACCITLMKVDSLSGMVREFLGPVIADVFGSEE
jgi:AbrB family looped-hinge helix DNA binding protein